MAVDKLSTNVISSGSKPGNCVTYLGGRVMVDCGTTNKKLEGNIDNLEVVIITHEHVDHIGKRNKDGIAGSAFRYIIRNKPSVMFVFAPYMEELAKGMGISNYTVVEPNTVNLIKDFYIALLPVSHNVPNVGVFIGSLEKTGMTYEQRLFKVFHCTDMGSYEGIYAKNFDVYGLEANYDEEQVLELIKEEVAEVGFSHRERSMVDHISIQETLRYIEMVTQGWDKYSFYPLHISGIYHDFVWNKYKKEITYDFNGS